MAPTGTQCDEKRPQCSHCNRHNIACEYPSLATRSYDPQHTRRSNTPVHRQHEGPRPDIAPHGGLAVLQLRLIHHWVTSTAATMSSAHIPAVHQVWSVVVPEMAFDYEPLLHTVLALSAAHRIILSPDEATTLRPIQHAYIDSSLRQHRPVTAQLDGSTSEAVCVNAILLSLYTIYLRSEPTSDAYEPPFLWLSVAHGIRTILKTVYGQLMGSDSKIKPFLLAKPMVFGGGLDMFKPPVDPFQSILEYERDIEDIDEETAEAYSQTTEYLGYLYTASQANEPEWVLRKIFFGFPPISPRRFTDLVTERRPRALVILAYLFALGKKVDNVWWFRGIPEREVRGINGIVPDNWKWAMFWPLNLISENPVVTPNGSTTSSA
ncbi:hypothetical protein N7456_003310 [Penicillium angulare]|uniref:Zn(2)-C6 fungal-type domain-containing protein n=1 Tax=Penicillium angulare TaxID=116970 RepID=A0A9W9KHF9_9EURO|nr:hypothetical protein N7456_003310 [Penicillium angulare]